MNEKVRNNYFFKTAKEFRERINKFFGEIIPNITDLLKARINDTFHIVDAASNAAK